MKKTDCYREDYCRKFEDNEWYNTTQAYKGLRMSRTGFWRRVSCGAIKWHVRRHYRGRWFKGRDLNQFYNAEIGF